MCGMVFLTSRTIKILFLINLSQYRRNKVALQQNTINQVDPTGGNLQQQHIDIKDIKEQHTRSIFSFKRRKINIHILNIQKLQLIKCSVLSVS